MKFLLLLCALISIAYASKYPTTVYSDARCIGLAQHISDKIDINYGICCDNGFPGATLTSFAPEQYANDCKNIRDEEYIRLTANRDVVKEHCSKELYAVDK